jgi:hypothetical protein
MLMPKSAESAYAPKKRVACTQIFETGRVAADLRCTYHQTMADVIEMARKGDKGRKAVWSAAEAESESDSLSDGSSESDLTESENDDDEPPCGQAISDASFVVFGSDGASKYNTVVSAAAPITSTAAFPLTEAARYSTVSYTTVHSPKRQTVYRARAITVVGPTGGLVHHVIETIELEVKAITALFAAQQVSDADISKRVLTKNSARHAKTADRFNVWTIMDSKNRDSYKALMVKGFGMAPTLVFATFYSDHLIATTVDQIRPSKKVKIAPTMIVPVAPVAPAALEPTVCQNMVWVDELNALIARAPAGVEKRFISTFFMMLK